MPMRVRTPEDIFRSEKKDLYVIHSHEKKERDAPGLMMIQAWIAENLPGTRMELLAPSEHSGFITGGIGRMIRVDFSDDGLRAFCDRWEKDDASVDPRFQCFIYPYQTWWDERGRFVPTDIQPDQPGVAVWWYTPIGFVHHILDLDEAKTRGSEPHPASEKDIWAHAVNLWPSLRTLDPEHMTSGKVIWNKKDSRFWLLYSVPFFIPEEKACVPTEDQVKAWFRLPPSTPWIANDW